MKTYSKLFRLISFGTLLLAGLFWIWLSRIEDHSSQSIQAPQVGFLAPEIVLSSLDTTEFLLSDLKGTPVILNFWASWCPPCRAEMADFQQLSQEYSPSKLMIIGINATNQDALANVNQFAADYSLTFPVLLDVQGTASRDYLVHSLPTTFFIAGDGEIKKVVFGGPLPLSFLRIEAENLIEGDN